MYFTNYGKCIYQKHLKLAKLLKQQMNMSSIKGAWNKVAVLIQPQLKEKSSCILYLSTYRAKPLVSVFTTSMECVLKTWHILYAAELHCLPKNLKDSFVKAFIHWGGTNKFMYLMFCYSVLQFENLGPWDIIPLNRYLSQTRQHCEKKKASACIALRGPRGSVGSRCSTVNLADG